MMKDDLTLSGMMVQRDIEMTPKYETTTVYSVSGSDDPIQFNEVWTKTIEKVCNELIENLIARLKKEGFVKVYNPVE